MVPSGPALDSILYEIDRASIPVDVSGFFRNAVVAVSHRVVPGCVRAGEFTRARHVAVRDTAIATVQPTLAGAGADAHDIDAFDDTRVRARCGPRAMGQLASRLRRWIS